MKHILLLILSIVFFTSCQNTTGKEPTKEVAEKRIDTIFLDYRFGMTEKEFRNHTEKLIKEGKLDNEGLYNFKFENYPSITAINPVFHNEKLYKLKLASKFTEDSPFTNQTLLYQQLVLTYIKKYSGFEKQLEGLAYEYTKSNMRIEILDNIYNPLVVYTDIPVETEVEAKKEATSKQNEAKTINDI